MQQKLRHTLVPIACAATVLAAGAAFSADQPSLQGRLVTPDGKTTIKEFPVIVEGKEKSVVVTTDQQGIFKVPSLPPGAYTVAPANEPDLKQQVTIGEPEKRWWHVFGNWVNADKTLETRNVGDIHVQAGKRY